MKWRGRTGSSNIEDRRGARSGGGFGRLGGGGFGPSGGFRIPTGGGGRGARGGIGTLIGVVVVLGLFWLLTGENPLDSMMGGSSGSSTSSTSYLPESGAEDELRGFVGVVIKETEDLWTEQFAAVDRDYPEPTVVLFSGQTNSAAGRPMRGRVRSIARRTRRSISTSASTTSCASSSARRATSRRPMCWPMKWGTMCRT